MHYGLQAQKRPLPGTRPEPLAEVSEPLGPAATVGYVAARYPLIWWGPKLLADHRWSDPPVPPQDEPCSEEEEQEERRRTQQETSQLQQRGPLAGAASSSRSVRRKRKKRSNKKLPKAPLLVVGVPVIFSDKFQQLFEFFVPQVQFLDRMVDIPVVHQRQVLTVFFLVLVQFLV